MTYFKSFESSFHNKALSLAKIVRIFSSELMNDKRQKITAVGIYTVKAIIGPRGLIKLSIF